jgi:glutathione synthase/RimK-type ligase-like ATP-grasp enzyme
MSLPRIAIATCAGYADLKVDDGLLQVELGTRGVEATAVVWDQEGSGLDGFDACLVRSTWDYHEKHGEFLAWARRIEATMPLWNDAETIAWNSTKTYLRELAAARVRTVPTVWVERGEQASLGGLLMKHGWEEAVVKPVVDLGARNLTRVCGDDAGQQALARILERHGAMVQPFLPSLEEQGELSLVYIAGHYSHAVRKRPAPGDFRVQSIWGGTVAPAEPNPAHLELAQAALSQVRRTFEPLCGTKVRRTPLYARVDLVEDLDGRPCLIELELIEPNLYLTQHPPAAGLLADAVVTHLR